MSNKHRNMRLQARGPEFAYPDQGSGPGSECARAQAQKKYLTGYWVLWYDPI